MSNAALRSLHGLLALALAAGLVLYTVSGWMIVHRVGWGEPSERALHVPAPAVRGADEDPARVAASARAAARAAGLGAAQPGKPRFTGGAWRVGLTRIARSAEVTLTPGAGEAQVALRDLSFATALKSLHRIDAEGARGGRLAWAIGIDVLSLALLAFAGTGLLLARPLLRRRRLGWALLAAGSLYTAAGIAWSALSA